MGDATMAHDPSAAAATSTRPAADLTDAQRHQEALRTVAPLLTEPDARARILALQEQQGLDPALGALALDLTETPRATTITLSLPEASATHLLTLLVDDLAMAWERAAGHAYSLP